LKAQSAFKRFAPVTMLMPLVIMGGFLAFNYYVRTTAMRRSPMPTPTVPVPAAPKAVPGAMPRGGALAPGGGKAAD
jgi:hypothetical protein